jgi:hypothetical protein
MGLGMDAAHNMNRRTGETEQRRLFRFITLNFPDKMKIENPRFAGLLRLRRIAMT